MAKSRRQFAGSSSSSRRGGDDAGDDDGTQETEEGDNDDLFRDHDGDASTINLGGGSASGARRAQTRFRAAWRPTLPIRPNGSKK
mgnify:CR=1 FL=1